MRNLIPEVKAMVERPFSIKWMESQKLIADNLMRYKGRVAVAFSGGKDSELVLYMTLSLCPDIDVVYNRTGVEYPETRKFIRELQALWGFHLIETQPVKSFWECADEYGLPQSSKRSRSRRGKRPKCCYWLKEKPMYLAIKEHKWAAYFTGTTAAESWTRMFVARDKGTCYEYKAWRVQKVHPILWWTEGEVWDYIDKMGIPANPIYKHIPRVGCMTCTAFKDWESQLSSMNLKLYHFIKEMFDRDFQRRLV